MKTFPKLLTSKKTAKVFDSLGARINNQLSGCLQKKIFFLHIDKCGGTSINQAIKSCYLNLDITQDRNLAHLNAIGSFLAAKKSIGQDNFPSDAPDDYTILKFRENLLLYYLCQNHIHYIGGHFCFSELAYQHFSQEYAFITLLREPVGRWISSYFFNRYKHWNHRKIDMDIAKYIESELGKSHGSEYVKFIGGPNSTEDYTSPEAIYKAKMNLHKFTLVGCLEYKNDFVKQFEESFGKKLRIGTHNKSPKSERYRHSMITEEVREKIVEICKPDIEIYQYAVDNFVNIKN